MPSKSNAIPGAAGGVVVAALLILFGVYALWDTTTYADPDSAVFPRAIASAMIVASLVVILRWLLGRSTPVEMPPPGSAIRRALLVAVMIVGSLSIPYTGFLPAALVVFAALLLIAMYDRWTPFRIVVYPLVGAAVVLGFYYLFSKVLLVPLPTASLF